MVCERLIEEKLVGFNFLYRLKIFRKQLAGYIFLKASFKSDTGKGIVLHLVLLSAEQNYLQYILVL